MDLGIINAAKSSINTPLPISWLSRADAPSALPLWATVGQLTSAQVKNLQAQIGYDMSQWDYNKIGANNELGRYQFSSTLLEQYGLLAAGSNKAYGNDCVNYKICWSPVAIRSTNSYANYQYNTSSLRDFLNSTVSQDHLAYQVVYDLYTKSIQIGSILSTDSADVVAGMIYVAWVLGVGTSGNSVNPSGTGSFAWRFFNTGIASQAFNAGRYSVTVLSQ